MQIVIDIPENIYKQFNVDCIYYPDDGKDLCVAVVKGTPLPKGHGRLIDADAIINTLGCSDRDIYVKACIEEDAPTIIEADKAESGE